jgi:hypothetical protein
MLFELGDLEFAVVRLVLSSKAEVRDVREVAAWLGQ